MVPEDYEARFRDAFPASPPGTLHDIIAIGARRGWFPHPFVGSEARRNGDEHYQALWQKQRTVEWTALVNDAIATVLDVWTPEHARSCIDIGDVDYDARLVTAGALYLSLTWPSPG